MLFLPTRLINKSIIVDKCKNKICVWEVCTDPSNVMSELSSLADIQLLKKDIETMKTKQKAINYIKKYILPAVHEKSFPVVLPCDKSLDFRTHLRNFLRSYNIHITENIDYITISLSKNDSLISGV